MNLQEQLIVLNRLDALIARAGTGNSKTLCTKLNLSRASLYRRLDDLKALGADIHYSKEKRSYVYQNDFQLEYALKGFLKPPPQQKINFNI